MPKAAAFTGMSANLTRSRVLIIAVSAVTGTCFAVLAGLSLSAFLAPFRSSHYFSLVIAVVSLGIAYMAIRAARAGRTGRGTAAAALVSGMVGAMAGVFLIIAILLMFRPDAQSLLAHSLGRPASTVTVFRLLVAGGLLGFGTGFVARVRASHR